MTRYASYEDVLASFQPYHEDLGTAERVLTRSPEKKLRRLLRDHRKKPVHSKTEIAARDAVDLFFQYLSITAVGLICEWIDELPPSTARTWRNILEDKTVTTYYQKYYPVRLVSWLRLYLQDRERPKTQSVPAGTLEQLCGLALEAEASPYCDDLLGLLDGYTYDGKGIADLDRLLKKPDTLAQYLVDNDPSIDVLTSAFIGLQEFLLFADSYVSLLNSLDDKPLAQSAFWHYFGYWFERLGSEYQGDLGSRIGIFLQSVIVNEHRHSVHVGSGRRAVEHRGYRAERDRLRIALRSLSSRKFALPLEDELRRLGVSGPGSEDIRGSTHDEGVTGPGIPQHGQGRRDCSDVCEGIPKPHSPTRCGSTSPRRLAKDRSATRSEVMQRIAKTTGLRTSDVDAVITALQREVGKSLRVSGVGVFIIPELVRFDRRIVPARPAMRGIKNPFTGELQDRPARPSTVKVRVRALQSLKAAVDR